MLRSTLLITLTILSNVIYAQTALKIDTIYYDIKWKIVSEKDKAVYYRIAEKLADKNYKVTDYFMDGLLQMTGTVTDPLCDGDDCDNGPFVYYFNNGVIQCAGNSVAGNRVGNWNCNYINGKKSSNTNYKNGLLDGKAIFYDSLTGTKKSEGIHVADEKHGKWHYYDTNGKVSRIVEYNNGNYHGKCVVYNTNTGYPIAEGIFKDDNKEGKWIYYYNKPDKKISLIENYKKGLLDGEAIKYDSIGNELLHSNYKDNLKSGAWKYYYYGSNKVWLSYYFTKDSLDKELISFYPSGKLKRKEVYDNGKILSSKCYAENGDEIEYYPILTGAQFEGDVMTYVGNTLVYPKDAKQQKIEGKVLVSFAVNESGIVEEPKVIKSVFKSLDAEALRIVEQMPPWQPARIDGQPYKSVQELPVVFWIQD